MSNRIEQLDSIKGLASIFVLLNHILLLLPSFARETETINNINIIFSNTPLRIFWAGNEAVLLFFILSGFVMSLSYINGRKKPYPQYLVKRICRLYIPFIISILIAVLMNHLFYTNESLINVSEWGNSQWRGISFSSLLNHVFFMGDYNTNVLNGPIWSLIHEMRISIIFPFLMIVFLRFNTYQNILLAMTLALTGYGLNIISNGSKVSFVITLYYTSFFIMGALLARHSNDMITFLNSKNRLTNIALLLSGLVLITYPYWFFPNTGAIHIGIVDEWISALGLLIVISCSLALPSLIEFLMMPSIIKLGEISFSLYLYHFIVILSLLYAFNGIIPLWIICILSIIVSIAVATFMYVYVEKQTIALGDQLVYRVRTKMIL